jgi:SagB-type dehydrogenase family enzyme
MDWEEYHELTKHTPDSLRRSRHALDWRNMPDPFRHYEGAPLVDLPADPPGPAIPALDLLLGAFGTTAETAAIPSLSQLFFHSAAISASKRAPVTGECYALRVNPSSGNLHPTEFHLLTPDGLYHYRPSSHMLERRAPGRDAPPVFVLTSIAWREAWKYQDRAYRYCLLDIGHAWQSLALAARAMGCASYAVGDFDDDEIAEFCRLAEDEWPMLMVELRGVPVPSIDGEGHGGVHNQLSPETIVYPSIEQIHAATKFNRRVGAVEAARTGSGEVKLPPPASSVRTFGETARARRSALDFLGGPHSITPARLSAILRAALQPLDADFASTRFIQLYLYVHRVDDLAPGVYRYWPDPAALELIKPGDQRFAAAGLSLGQDLAGNSCVAFSMIADIDRAVRRYGDRGYRYVHFEAGAIGQRLYLAAEALGLGATGIGAFFDDAVHGYLDLAPEDGQVVYHFAIGYPVPDPRLPAQWTNRA